MYCANLTGCLAGSSYFVTDLLFVQIDLMQHSMAATLGQEGDPGDVSSLVHGQDVAAWWSGVRTSYLTAALQDVCLYQGTAL